MGFKILQDALEKAGISKTISAKKKEAGLTDHLKPNKSEKKKKNDEKSFRTRTKAQRLPEGKIVVKVKKRAKPLPQPKVPEPLTPKNSVIIAGPLSLHPLLTADPTEDNHRRIHTNKEGTRYNVSSDPKETADLVIGLDFGTSSTKAVIRDVSLEKSFAVPFYSDKDGANNFLFPSHIFRKGNSYSLDGGDECFRDLKLSLINSQSDSDKVFDRAAIYLALLLRHCRGWLFDAYAGRYIQTEIWWKLNLGLPARHYEDDALVKKFEKLAWCAEYLAIYGNDTLTDEEAEKVKRKWQDEHQSLETEIDVVPEIAAQIYGYIRSGHWDKGSDPVMMMVDIGAGTLDAAFFSVTQDDSNNLTYTFLGVDVQPLGVMNLHRDRIKWLFGILSESCCGETDAIEKGLESISVPTDKLTAIPENVGDYLIGAKISINDKSHFIDHNFLEKIPLQINRCALRPVEGMPRPQPINRWEAPKHHFPIFLCGGGSRMQFYKKILAYTDKQAVPYRFRKKGLPTPYDLQTEAIKENYDRLSVAYGLSWHMAGEKPLGKFIRSLDVPKEDRAQSKSNYEEHFISKDQV